MRLTLAATILMLAFCVGGCASDPVARGHAAYKRNDCATAANLWFSEAKKGDPAAQYNLGYLLKRGCPAGNLPANPVAAFHWYSTSAKFDYPAAYEAVGIAYLYGDGVAKDEQKAIANFYYAARWGQETSIEALRALNVPVPPADLLAAVRSKQKDEADANAAVLDYLVTSTVDGYVAGKSAGAARASSSKSYSSPGSPSAPPAQVSRSSMQVYSGACSSDYDCGSGKRCVKPLYQGTGVCLQAVNQFGNSQPVLPSPDSIGSTRTTPSCNYSTDCPASFRCDTALKVCVR